MLPSTWWNQAWWSTNINPELKRRRQEGQEFKVAFSDTMSLIPAPVSKINYINKSFSSTLPYRFFHCLSCVHPPTPAGFPLPKCSQALCPVYHMLGGHAFKHGTHIRRTCIQTWQHIRRTCIQTWHSQALVAKDNKEHQLLWAQPGLGGAIPKSIGPHKIQQRRLSSICKSKEPLFYSSLQTQSLHKSNVLAYPESPELN